MTEQIKKSPSKATSSSLRFPKNNLELCLEKIKLLFNKNARNLMSTEAMSIDMGFSGQNGSSDSFLASLKYYGLLEKGENNRYKIADFIIDYCISHKVDKESIRKCLLVVPINKKLFAAYDIDSLPSENEIKSFLIKDCGYSLKDTTTYIDIFNKNILLYKSCTQEVLSKELNKVEESTPTPTNQPSNVAIQSGIRVFTHPLNNDKYITIQLPANIQDLDKRDLEDASDLLNLVLNKITKQIEKI